MTTPHKLTAENSVLFLLLLLASIIVVVRCGQSIHMAAKTGTIRDSRLTSRVYSKDKQPELFWIEYVGCIVAAPCALALGLLAAWILVSRHP